MGSWSRQRATGAFQPCGLRWALQEFRVGPGPHRGSWGLSCQHGDSRGGDVLIVAPCFLTVPGRTLCRKGWREPGFPSTVHCEPTSGRQAGGRPMSLRGAHYSLRGLESPLFDFLGGPEQKVSWAPLTQLPPGLGWGRCLTTGSLFWKTHQPGQGALSTSSKKAPTTLSPTRPLMPYTYVCGAFSDPLGPLLCLPTGSSHRPWEPEPWLLVWGVPI